MGKQIRFDKHPFYVYFQAWANRTESVNIRHTFQYKSSLHSSNFYFLRNWELNMCVCVEWGGGGGGGLVKAVWVKFSDLGGISDNGKVAWSTGILWSWYKIMLAFLLLLHNAFFTSTSFLMKSFQNKSFPVICSYSVNVLSKKKQNKDSVLCVRLKSWEMLKYIEHLLSSLTLLRWKTRNIFTYKHQFFKVCS